MLFLGVDPGKSGALACIGPNGMLEIRNWPEDLSEAWEMVKVYQAHGCVAALEQVSSMPKQGVRSVWTFGQWYGRQEAMLVAAGIAVERVKPERWQRSLGCLSGGDKKITCERARLLFPGHSKITQRAADAVLLAEYCRRLFEVRHGEKKD